MACQISSLAVLLVAACGNGSAGARTDADAWPCSIEPIPKPSQTERDVTLLFDVGLDSPLEGDYGAVALFLRDDRFLSFSYRSVHRVSLDGGIVEDVPFASSFDSVELMDVAMSPLGFGAVFRVWSAGDLSYRFCTLDENGEFADSRCVSFTLSPIVPAVVGFDGSQYRVYAVRDGMLHRWTYDDSPALVAEDDLWPTEGVDSDTLDVLSVPSGAEVILTLGVQTEGVACGTFNEHSTTTGTHSARSLLASGFAGGGYVAPRFATGSPGQASLIYEGVCVIPANGECSNVVGRVSFYTSYRDFEPVLDRVPIWMPTRASEASVLDSGSIVTFYYTFDTEDIRVSRLSTDADLEISELLLPLGYTEPGRTADSVFAAYAVSANDYSLVYTFDGVEGRETRLARFSIAPP